MTSHQHGYHDNYHSLDIPQVQDSPSKVTISRVSTSVVRTALAITQLTVRARKWIVLSLQFIIRVQQLINHRLRRQIGCLRLPHCQPRR
jgi:hypothetical protein